MTIDEIRKLHPQYDMPDFPGHPAFSNIVVWRIPNQEKTAGGLYVPDTAKEPRSRGVLLAAGLGAYEELKTNGVELGDIVQFAKYAGADVTAKERIGETDEQIMVLKSGDILLSEGLKQRLESGAVALGFVEAYQEYQFLPNDGGTLRKRVDPKRRN